MYDIAQVEAALRAEAKRQGAVLPCEGSNIIAWAVRCSGLRWESGGQNLTLVVDGSHVATLTQVTSGKNKGQHFYRLRGGAADRVGPFTSRKKARRALWKGLCAEEHWVTHNFPGLPPLPKEGPDAS